MNHDRQQMRYLVVFGIDAVEGCVNDSLDRVEGVQDMLALIELLPRGGEVAQL